ncbi:enoyl-CoA hydratase-related protein [Bacillus dakarensis]|uniref:enoyl-CoA hydratase-related protein n=1 Tax=Robertmurraya dakarensis TaxID=1926278 RepID=UPI001115A527|nr:enoyl-CoA hydratase-related protein [Bacillus dakarensis]
MLKNNASYIYLEKVGPIATINLNRPEKRNAMNYEMWCELPGLLFEVDSDLSIKVVVIRGVNNVAFSAGADISEFQEIRSNKRRSNLYDHAIAKANQSLANLSKPTIAMIQGFCVGGGAGIALACDFRFSDENGQFGITPAKIGLVYGTAATKRIVDLVGPSKTKDILMTGRLMDAQEALQIGFIDRIYHSESIKDETYRYANLIANRAQYTVRAAKKIVNEILHGTNENTPELKELIERAYDTEDYQEGVKAFIEKRRPKFKEN